MKFKKIAAAFMAALMIFVCSVASTAFAAGGEGGGSARTSVCEKFLEGTDLELYRMLLECMSWVADGRRNADTFYLTLSGSYANTIEYEKAILKVMYFIRNYTNEYTYWVGSHRRYAADNKSSCRITYEISPAYKSLDNRISKTRLDDVNRALENAKKIADRYEGKSDYDKIVGYAKEICALNEYNHPAADDDNYFSKNSNPWNIIYVFDGDLTTNVVCEGYGRAFQYLCDLGGIECHYVTGNITGGGHGWNIVVLDGKSYLVDLTMCDSFSEDIIEKYHPFVLNSVVSSTSTGFSAHYSGDGGSLFVSYTYDDEEMEYLPEDLLTLSTKDYAGGRSKVGAVIVIVLAAAGIAFYIIRKKKKAKQQNIFFYN
ncbi:MAG: hypothetical protein K2N56_00720 [Oscillospiraceae bacterium]|nr:hypothetical protein [Oscillospiraceae bacterium]